MASSYSPSTTLLRVADRGVIEQGNGRGLELKPSEKAKLQGKGLATTKQTENTGEIDIHIWFDILSFLIFNRLYLKSPQNASDVNCYRCRTKMHAGADAPTPAEGAVPECARIISLLHKSLRFKFMGFWEVCLI
jgi:hypothetical protein